MSAWAHGRRAARPLGLQGLRLTWLSMRPRHLQRRETRQARARTQGPTPRHATARASAPAARMVVPAPPLWRPAGPLTLQTLTGRQCVAGPAADGASAADPAGFQAGLQAGSKRPCGPALQLHRLFDDMPDAAAELGSLPGGGGGGGDGGGADGADAVGEVGRDFA